MIGGYVNIPIVASSVALVAAAAAWAAVDRLQSKDVSDVCSSIVTQQSFSTFEIGRKWRCLGDDDTNYRKAFEIGQAKLPMKSISLSWWSVNPEIERNLEISKIQMLLNYYLMIPGYLVVRSNVDKNGCEFLFNYDPSNVRFVNKLLSLLLGALSNNSFDAEVIIRELKNYELFANIVKKSDSSPGRAYARELLPREDICELCKLALPSDDRCESLFALHRAWEHRKRTEQLLQGIELRRAQRDAIDLSKESPIESTSNDEDNTE